jgi:DNA repair photolyase
MKVKLIKTKAKEIFTKTKLPGSDWVINQYVGCQHACLYCYAKFISRWRPDNYGKWGSWIEAKMNAPDLVKGRQVKGWVYMSSISDPYSPIEKDLELTRKTLTNLDKKTKLCLQTKSNLVLRDIDIFKQFNEIEVGLTINSFKDRETDILEPFSSPITDRIEALKSLNENQVKTFAFVSPIIPELIDLREIIKDTKEFTDYYWFEFINIRGAGRDFLKTLTEKFPKSYKTLKDKKKFSDFIKESKKIISSENIRVRGMEIH